MSQPEVWAVVPAGGSGSRFSSTQDKLLALLGGNPVLLRTLEALASSKIFEGIFLVASKSNLPIYQKVLASHFPAGFIRFTEGGASRRDSVYNGLRSLPNTAQIVAIHDAARPLVTASVIHAAIEATLQNQCGAIAAIPVVDTIKQVDPQTMTIQTTVSRDTLWRAQTPQVFYLQPLLAAHQQIPETLEATDDAQLMELSGAGPVQIVTGSASNLKITGPEDILLAESFLSQ